MTKKITIQDKIQFNAIHDLCVDLDQETDPVLVELSQRLQFHLSRIRGPITLQTEILLATKEISENEIARCKLNDILSQNDILSKYGKFQSVKGYYSPIEGGGYAIPPGPALYCPIDGCHYRQFQIQKGVQMHCKYHPFALLVNRPPKEREE